MSSNYYLNAENEYRRQQAARGVAASREIGRAHV